MRILPLILLPLLLSASSVPFRETDFIARSINFLIFAALIGYLVVPRLKEVLKSRSLSIATKLSNMQDDLNASRASKEASIKKLASSKSLAHDLIAGAKKDAHLIAQKAEERCKKEIDSIKSNLHDLMRREEINMKEEVVAELLDELSVEASELKDYLVVIVRELERKAS